MRRIVPVDDAIENLARIEGHQTNSNPKRVLKRTESVVDVNLISSFCPTILLESLVSGTTLSTSRRFLNGACLIADISGFVKLCGDLSKCGAEGFDDLQICTRNFIGELVKIVYHYGGDVISFAGDAVICFFPSSSDPSSCCRRAILCSFEMKELRSLQLTAHIGVSFGEICFASLGGAAGQWVYLMSGEPLTEISSCVNDAKAGESVFTKKCYDFANSGSDMTHKIIFADQISSGNFRLVSVSSHDLSSKNPWRPPVSLLTQALENIFAFIPPAVRASIVAGSFNALSELREVTTMFLKLDSYSHVAHRDLLTLQPFFEGIQEMLSESGGFLRQFLVDDKGCVLIALWGVPKSSFPNNCSRALSCATRARSHARKVGHSCSIGITTGHAYCGTVGSILRQEYVAMGDAVNLAARLMGKANGRILVDETTFLRLPTAVSQYLQLGEHLHLKGRDESLQPYLYNSESLPSLPSADDLDDHTIVIDKDVAAQIGTELDQLSSYQTDTIGIIAPGLCQIEDRIEIEDEVISPPEVRLIIVGGVPGSGKSTVADFFQKGSHRRNIRSIFIKLSSDTKTVNFGLIRKLFVELVGSSRFSTERKQRQVILSLLRHNYPGCDIDLVLKDHFPILQYALGLDWNFNTPTSPKNPSRGSKFYGDTTLQRLLHSLISVCCTTLIIEDAHFCDELSMKEINLLMSIASPLVILCTIRLQAEQVALQMHRKPSFKNKFGNMNEKSTVESPGRLKDSPNLRSHFYPEDLTSRPLGPRSNSQRRMSVPISSDQASKEELSLEQRRRFTISDTPATFRELYTHSVSNSHSQSKQPNKIIAKGKQTLFSKYGLRVKEDTKEFLGRKKNYVTIQLPNLSSQQVQQILASSLPDADVSNDFADLVLEVTGGNPYWVKSIAKFVRASGIQEFTSSIENPPRKGCDSPDKNQNFIGVQRLEHHIVCHLERFSVQQQTMCKFASIIGDEFHLEVLLKILPPKFQNRDALSKSLDSLSGEGIVVLISEDPPVYSFQNELIRKTLYDIVLPSEAAGIHGKIGNVMESLFADNLRPYYPSLSYHYAMGSNCRSHAFKYTVKAADQSISSGNFGTGLLYLLHAQSLLKYDSELLILLRVAETALFDMSPKYSLRKRFPQANQDKLASASSFTQEDILNYENLVDNLTQAENSMELFGVKIVRTHDPVLRSEDPQELRGHLSESNGDLLVSLPSYVAKHPKNTRSTCLIS